MECILIAIKGKKWDMELMLFFFFTVSNNVLVARQTYSSKGDVFLPEAMEVSVHLFVKNSMDCFLHISEQPQSLGLSLYELSQQGQILPCTPRQSRLARDPEQNGNISVQKYIKYIIPGCIHCKSSVYVSAQKTYHSVIDI